MSYFEDASLVLIPSAVKISKAYSIKPTDGSGDLTFTRTGDTATRIAPNGLIEKVRTNFILQSQTFNAIVWTLNDATLTSGQSGYDGSSDAWKLTESATTAEHYVRQTPTLSGLATISIYAKADANDWIYFRGVTGGVNVRAWFDLQNGVVGTTNGPVVSHSIQSVGGGWYRCSMAWSHQSGFECYIGISNADGVVLYAGDGTSGVFIQNAQAETGDIATAPITTLGSAVSVGPVANLPRLDYLGSSCGKLLLEGQRTNLITFSESFDNAVWTKTSIAVTANATTSPDGYSNADLFTTNNPAGTVYRAYHNSTGGTDATNTISGFFKYGNHPYAYITADSSGFGKFAIFNVQTGVVTFTSSGYTSTITDYGNGWYRCTLTGTMDSNNNIQFGLSTTESVYAGTSLADGKTMYVWGAQREYNVSYESSYVNTLGAAVTRGADFMYKASLGSAIFGTTDGVVFLETGQCYNNDDTSATKDFISVEKDGSNWFGIASGGSSAAPTIRFVTRIAGVVSTDADISGLSNAKIAIKYSAANFKIFVNGSLQETVAKSIGNYQDVYFMVNASDDLTMPLKQFLVFPTALSDADCIALTA